MPPGELSRIPSIHQIAQKRLFSETRSLAGCKLRPRQLKALCITSFVSTYVGRSVDCEHRPFDFGQPTTRLIPLRLTPLIMLPVVKADEGPIWNPRKDE